MHFIIGLIAIMNTVYQLMKKENAHECAVCRVKFTLKSRLKIHVSSVYEGKKAPEMWLMCYQFFNKKQLEQTHRLQFMRKRSFSTMVAVTLALQAKEIEIIHRLFLVIAMYCQASSINHSTSHVTSWLGIIEKVCST